MGNKQSLPICHTRHAIILAAGESTRTRPLTRTRPKPLISLVGKPLLAHIMDELVGLVDDITLVVGYRADAIRATFGSSYRAIALHYVHQHTVNGTAGALLTVEEQATTAGVPPLDAPFFLLYGDNLISHRDIVSVCQERYCMAGLRVADPTAFGVLDIVAGRVERIIEKPPSAPPDSLVNPGIYHFDGAVFPAVRAIQPSPRGEYELTDLIATLAQHYRVGYAACRGHWIPVGTPWDVLLASHFILEQHKSLRSVIAPDVVIPADTTITGYVQIASGVQLGAGCHIVGPVFLGAGAVIGDGSTIVQSVVEADATVGNGCHVDHAVLGRGSVLAHGGIMEYSLLDEEVVLPVGVHMRAHLFTDLHPVAETTGLLSHDILCHRGAIVGKRHDKDHAQREQEHIVAGTVVPPGSILMHG